MIILKMTNGWPGYWRCEWSISLFYEYDNRGDDIECGGGGGGEKRGGRGGGD